MAGDIELTHIGAYPPIEGVREYVPKATIETPDVPEEQFETPDVSAERRKALETAVSAQQEETKGRFVIEQDKETGKFIQKIVDPDTGEVLEQWPDEKLLELAKSMGEAYGLLVDQNV